jgi:uncharacterized protein (DUF2141 family)
LPARWRLARPRRRCRPGRAGAARVEVDVVGVRGDDGTIGCQLFASEAGFPRDTGAAVAKMLRPIAGGSATCVFSGLNAGNYAVAVMHDENGNGALDANIVGIPTEGYGVSNNRTHALSAPKWDESRFTLAAGESKRLSVRLRY